MSDKAANEVGYCKPPKHTQFKPGQSGCPTGRKKKPKTFDELMLAELSKTKTVTMDGKKQKLTQAEVVVVSLMRKAMQGDHKAALLAAMALQKAADSAVEAVKPLTPTEMALLAELLNQSEEDGAKS